MHIRNLILTIFTTFAAVLMLAVSLPVCSQELANQDTLIADDSLAVDTIMNSDPEWYVAPMTHDLARAPFRAPAAACPIDSVRTFNVDSVLESVSVYEYGDTTRTMIWTVNPDDGSRYGSGREESASTASSTYSATYAWDNTTNDWAGTSREEHYFVAGKDTTYLVYAWVNNAWVVNTKYTYVFDGSGRETEFTTYERNASGQLAYSKQRIREYNAAGKTTLDIQYTAHNGSDWSAGTKELWEFNASSLQTLREKYTLANSDWTITLREIKGYDAANNNDLIENYALQNNVWKGTKKEEYVFNSNKKKTSSIIYAWSNGAWVGSSKEIWAFNGPSAKQTLHEKYGWANGDWAITLQENSGYDAVGNNTLIENYTYTNGAAKGTKKITYTYDSSNRQVGNVTYKWTNNAWEESAWTVTGYDEAGNKNMTCQYKWKDGAWVGSGYCTLTTFNGSKKPVEVINQVWSTDVANWVNYTRSTTEYSGAKTTQEATYTWSADANDWVGNTRSDWHYNAAGQNDTTKTYTNNGTSWVYSERTVNTFNAAGTNIMTHKSHWDENKWVLVSATRTDVINDDAGRQVLYATWKCEADSVWMGLQKDSTSYSSTGKQLYKIIYTFWADNAWVPSYRIENQYDAADYMTLTQRFDYSSNTWVGNYRYEYGYDEQGRQCMVAKYIGWNASTNKWIGSTKTENTFDQAGRVTVSVVSFWGANSWGPAFRYLYTFDSSGREIENIIEMYENGQWVNSEKYLKEYNGGIQIKDNSYIWSNEQWAFKSRNETYYDDDAQAKLRREVVGLWDSNNGELLSFSDDRYFYACDPKSAFTIRFENEDGTLLESKEVVSGTVPTYDSETPTKDGNEQYTYSFKGWDKAIEPATADATYTATYNTVVNTYLITFMNGETVLQSGQVAYGTEPTYNGETPTKDGNEQYTYSFKGWDKAIAAVTGAATYNAVFDTTVNTYLITFMNGDVTLQSGQVAYGTEPTYNDETPTKDGNEQYTYSFKGWDAEIVAVTGDATYSAAFDSIVNTYLITFKNGDETLQSTEVEYGSVPAYEGAEPTKPSDAQYTYTFVGWDVKPVAVTGEATYSATFSSTLNKYLITFKNGDETLQSTEVEYGSEPAYEGATPTKPSDAQYSYTFAGWDVKPVAVTGEATYSATFSSTVNKYLITFKNGDETLQSTEVEYGVAPVYTGEMPSRPATAEFTYTFAGWDAELAAVTGEATYNAVFSQTQVGYTITWLNEDATLIDQTIVAFGTVPEHADATKENTAEFTYTFVGWDKPLSAVTADETYTAQYDSVRNKYTITFLFDDGVTVMESVVVAYGETPATTITPSKIAEEHYYYHFIGWTPAVVPVTGEATYTAIFDTIPQEYLITFKNYNGKVLQKTNVPYGTMPEYTGVTPTKPRTRQYSYEFVGWNPELTEVAGATTYTAQFEDVLNQYTVVFLDEDGTELDRQVVDYGTKPVYQGETPVKAEDEQYTYTFAGWYPAVVTVTKDATYRATYTAHDKSQGLWGVQDGEPSSTKIIRNGTLYILRAGKTYTTDGVMVEQ